MAFHRLSNYKGFEMGTFLRRMGSLVVNSAFNTLRASRNHRHLSEHSTSFPSNTPEAELTRKRDPRDQRPNDICSPGKKLMSSLKTHRNSKWASSKQRTLTTCGWPQNSKQYFILESQPRSVHCSPEAATLRELKCVEGSDSLLATLDIAWKSPGPEDLSMNTKHTEIQNLILDLAAKDKEGVMLDTTFGIWSFVVTKSFLDQTNLGVFDEADLCWGNRA